MGKNPSGNLLVLLFKRNSEKTQIFIALDWSSSLTSLQGMVKKRQLINYLIFKGIIA